MTSDTEKPCKDLDSRGIKRSKKKESTPIPSPPLRDVIYDLVNFRKINIILAMLGQVHLWLENRTPRAGNQAIVQAPVVQRLDNVIHRINHYPVDQCHQNKPRYPLDRDLSGG